MVLLERASRALNTLVFMNVGATLINDVLAVQELELLPFHIHYNLNKFQKMQRCSKVSFLILLNYLFISIHHAMKD